MSNNNKRAILAFPMLQNLAAINGHHCVGCGKGAAESAIELARQHDANIGPHMQDVERIIDAGTTALRKTIADMCANEGLDEAAYQGICIQAAYKTQVEVIDHAFAEKHPFGRVAFLAATLRGLLYGTMIGTANTAEEQGIGTDLEEFHDTMDNAIDKAPIAFQSWLDRTVTDEDMAATEAATAGDDAAGQTAYQAVMDQLDKIFPPGAMRDRIRAIATETAIEAGVIKAAPAAEPEVVIAGDTMPQEVADAIQRMFPGASIEGFKVVKLPRGS